MSQPLHRTAITLAVVLLIGAAGRAADDTAAIAPRVLSEVRRQIDAGLYRAAEETLQSQLDAAKKSGAPGIVRHRLQLLLAEVFYQSGQYDKARTAAESAIEQLKEHRLRHPEHVFTAEGLDAALWQTRVELALSKSGKPRLPHAESIPDVESWPEQLPPARQAVMLELLVLRAELNDLRTAPLHDPAYWSAVRGRAEIWFHDIPERPEFAAVRLSTVRSLARCLEGEQQPTAAVDVLQKFLHEPCYTDPNVERKAIWRDLKTLWSDVAHIRHRAKQYPQEVDAWREVLGAESARPVADHAILPALDHFNAEAEVRLDLAEALHGADKDTESANEQRQAVSLYRQVLQRVEGAPPDSPERPELAARQVAALQGLLLQVCQTQRHSDARRNDLLKGHFLTDADALHKLLVENRLDGDPILHQVAATVVQVLISQAEIDRADGLWRNADVHLETAAEQYRKTGLNDKNLWLWMQIYRGRLEMARGDSKLAEQLFREVSDRAVEQEDKGIEALAHLSLAVLYKGQGEDRFNEAEKQCQAAVDIERKRLGDNDRELLPYRLVLAGILIARHEIDEAQEQVDLAKQLAGPLSNDRDTSPATCEAHHLAAMLDLARYESDHDDAMAEKACQEWTELYEQQQRLDLPPEQRARTCYYLSRLALLRWQREVLVLRGYDAGYREYQAQCDAYQDDLKRYRAQYNQFVKDEAARERRDTQARRSLTEPLQHELKKLTQFHNELLATKMQLAEQQAILDRNYQEAEAARDKIVPRAQQAGRPSASPPLLATAESKAREAVDIVENSPSYPGLHFVVLCHYADVLRMQAARVSKPNPEEVARRLAQAVRGLEDPRGGLAEDDSLRAEFLAQYAAAYDQLVAWYVEHDDPAEALVYAELCRSRAFLDRLRGPGYDPLHPRSDEDQKLLENAGFSKTHIIDELRTAVRRRVMGGPCTLYYYVGAADCYLFVLGAGPQVIARRLCGGTSGADAGARVTAEVIGRWADKYAEILRHREMYAQVKGHPEKLQDWVCIAHQLLPPWALDPLMRALERRDRRLLLISPAGALEQIPFEALLVDEGDRPFLIDKLPARTGTLYVPSLMIAETLQQSRSAPSTMSLLTVGIGDFSKFPPPKPPNLDLAVKESEAVAQSFASNNLPFSQLLEQDATEGRFRAAIALHPPACLHVATHAVSREDGVALLMLWPGPHPSRADDDGQLKTSEIYGLSLQGCELAVLSACGTADGSGMPREMAASLARAFLAARARRVVASQWEVADVVSYRLITQFLAEVAGDWRSTGSCDYASRLQAARRDLRQSEDNPYIWSSFVLIGSAD